MFIQGRKFKNLIIRSDTVISLDSVVILQDVTLTYLTSRLCGLVCKDDHTPRASKARSGRTGALGRAKALDLGFTSGAALGA